jgi:putative endonuclease
VAVFFIRMLNVVDPVCESREWSLYLVRCGDDSLYTGITTDVVRRFQEHLAGGPKSAKYLRGRGPLKLVYYVQVGSHSEALRAERRMKRLNKAAKEKLL